MMTFYKNIVFFFVFNFTISNTKCLYITYSEIGKTSYKSVNFNNIQMLDDSTLSFKTNTLKIQSYSKSDYQISTVENLSSLRTISIENVEQRVIPELKNVPLLTDVYMQKNKLTYLRKENFGNTNSVYLFLRFNNIFYIEDGSFGPKTKHLYLQCNHLDHFEPKWFQNPAILNVLDLDKNDITSIQPGAFKDFKKLEYIYLTSNGIHTIGEYAFSGSNFISELWLASNALTTLPEKLFGDKNMVLLERFDISYNKLTYLTQDFFNRVNVTVSLSVDGNPWQCSCYFYHIIPWAGSKISFRESKIGEARCIGDDVLTQRCRAKRLDEGLIENFRKEITYPRSKEDICANKII